MFPVFPVLFPVCSQFSATAFNVFPMFPVSATGEMDAVSSIGFSVVGNTGNNGNSMALVGLTARRRWNKRGMTGNRCRRGG
jgi:hypothetical protein